MCILIFSLPSSWKLFFWFFLNNFITFYFSLCLFNIILRFFGSCWSTFTWSFIIPTEWVYLTLLKWIFWNIFWVYWIIVFLHRGIYIFGACHDSCIMRMAEVIIFKNVLWYFYLVGHLELCFLNWGIRPKCEFFGNSDFMINDLVLSIYYVGWMWSISYYFLSSFGTFYEFLHILYMVINLQDQNHLPFWISILQKLLLGQRRAGMENIALFRNLEYEQIYTIIMYSCW